MADLFGKIKKGIDKGINIASQKSGELVEAGKLQTQIIALKNDRKSSINDLGKVTYDMLKSDSFELEILEEKFKKILEIEKEIEEKEEAKKNADKGESKGEEQSEEQPEEKAVVFCPNCGAENPEGSVFCSKCGTKMTE
jgi:ribosomal protein L40E